VRGDATGRYELALAPGWYRIVAGADGYTAAFHQLEVRADETLDLRLNAGATIAGRVLDPDRRPAPGAVVAVGARTTIAGPEGRFSLDGMRPGRFEVLAAHGDLVAPPREVTVAYGGAVDVELVLAVSRAAIAGRVVDGDGHPVANARVEADGPLARHAVTGADGTYRIAGLVAGTYEVAGTAADLVRASTSAVVGPDGESTADLRLARGVTVRGVVRTARGEPVAGATVATSAANLRDPRLDVTTDARGAFRVGPLPTGQVRLSAYHREHGISEIVHVDLPAGSSPEAELVFRAAARITGIVRHDDGTPAAGAQVTITPADAPARWSLTADREGRFAVDALPDGEYWVAARPPVAAAPQTHSSRKAWRSVTLAAGAPREVELEVPGGREHVRGRVVDGSGAPVAGAAVWAERVWKGMTSPASLDDVPAYSWTDGAFDLAELPRGTYTVYAQHPDGRRGSVQEVASGAANVVLAVAGGARVTGRVVGRDGRPVRAFQVRWQWISRKTSSGTAMTNGTTAVHHPDGEFALDHLDPTSMIVVSVETPDGATGEAPPFALAAGEVRGDVRITVAGMGAIRGRLVNKRTGAPLLGHTVFLPIGGARGGSPTDGQGRFEARLPAGAYDHINMQNEAQGYPDVPVKFTVEPGRTSDLGTIEVELP
ncbi:MAG: carboxypeptidase regulatory-like domain-containing protein, partial [Deltaproteobacteria bacterium]|nr:carboxypeptidase regulatory-like domain-containing protein [Deltaproteobacteria bacterium]